MNLRLWTVTLLMLFTLAGCATNRQGGIKNKTTILKPHGTEITSVTEAVQPTNPADKLIYTNFYTGEYVGVPESQSAAQMEDAKQDGKNKRLLYAGAALILVIGAVAFALPNQLVSNYDAIIICVIALVAFGSLRYVEASEQVMGYVLPVAIVAGVGWVAYRYVDSKKKEDQTE